MCRTTDFSRDSLSARAATSGAFSIRVTVVPKHCRLFYTPPPSSSSSYNVCTIVGRCRVSTEISKIPLIPRHGEASPFRTVTFERALVIRFRAPFSVERSKSRTPNSRRVENIASFRAFGGKLWRNRWEIDRDRRAGSLRRARQRCALSGARRDTHYGRKVPGLRAVCRN